MKTSKNEFAGEDSVVAEVHAARASLIKEFGSARAYIAHLHAHPKPGVKYVSLPRKRPAGFRKAV